MLDNKFLNIINDMTENDVSSLLYGLFLGDGCYHNGWLIIDHTNKQKSYVLWLKEIFNICNFKTGLKENYEKTTIFGKYTYTTLRIKVRKEDFEKDNRCFDENHHKIISDYVLDNISIFGLLLWYLDDGSLIVNTERSSRFAYLNTQSFTYNENVKIVNMFKNRFDIDLKIHTDTSGFDKSKKYYRIYFSSKSFCKFIDIIRKYIPYIPKELLYKFDLKYKITNRKNSRYLVENYNIENLLNTI